MLDVGVGYSVMPPDVVILPILSLPGSGNHSAPSGPVVIHADLVPTVGRGYQVKLTDCAYKVAGICSRNTARHRYFAGALRARCNRTPEAVTCTTNREARCIVIERSIQVLRRSLCSWYEHHVPRVSVPEKDPARLVRPGGNQKCVPIAQRIKHNRRDVQVEGLNVA